MHAALLLHGVGEADLQRELANRHTSGGAQIQDLHVPDIPARHRKNTVDVLPFPLFGRRQIFLPRASDGQSCTLIVRGPGFVKEINPLLAPKLSPPRCRNALVKVHHMLSYLPIHTIHIVYDA